MKKAAVKARSRTKANSAAPHAPDPSATPTPTASTPSTAPPTTALPGRPRDPAVDEAVLRAALELFFDHGVEGTSIAAIARRAGVAKTSIYRRWPSREALLAQAVEAFRSTVGPPIELVDQAPPDAFLPLLLEGVSGVVSRPEMRKLMARLIGSVADQPQLMAVYRRSYLGPRRAAAVRAFARMQAAGLAPADADPELLADLVIGTFLQRVVMGLGGEDTPETLQAYLRRLFAQLGFTLPAANG